MINISSETFSKRRILDPSKLKQFADDNFKFDENGRKFSKWLEDTVGKGEIAHYELSQTSPDFYMSALRVNLESTLGKEEIAREEFSTRLVNFLQFSSVLKLSANPFSLKSKFLSFGIG